MNTTPLPGGSTPVLASSRLRRITLIAGTVGLLWVVVISLLGVWRLDQLTTRHVSALQANAGRMADANTVVLGRSFDALRTVADMIAREERLGARPSPSTFLARGRHASIGTLFWMMESCSCSVRSSPSWLRNSSWKVSFWQMTAATSSLPAIGMRA